MRIHRLDLTRYGIFTDHTIVFGERPATEPDLHIIYGPNEAGKSTTFSAFLDILYGIEARSPYDFKHSYKTMQVGGLIDVNGVSVELARIKRSQNSLLDGSGSPISDSVILGELAGIDRSSYATMFSLDDETLEAGGESILASKGDLGQLLFSASAGLSDLGQKLMELNVEASKFYKARSRNTELSALKERLDQLKKERETLDTVASEYGKLIKERDRITQQYNEVVSERSAAKSSLDGLRRKLSALPRLAELRRLRSRIDELSDLPDAPRAWIKDLPDLQSADVRLKTRAQDIERDKKGVTEKLNALIINNDVLTHDAQIEALIGERARYVVLSEDLPKTRLELRDVNVKIAGILHRMACRPDADPGSLILSTGVIGTLRELMEKHSGIVGRLESAEEEFAAASQRLQQARKKLGDVSEGVSGGISGDISGEHRSHRRFPQAHVISVITVAQSDDYALRKRRARRDYQQHMEAMQASMRLLSPWAGSYQGLRELCVPELSQIEDYKALLANIEKGLERDESEVERYTVEQRKLRVEIDAENLVLGELNNHRSGATRAARESAWARHKEVLDMASAEKFEACLRQDDMVSNSRMGHASEVARLNQMSITLATVDAELDAAKQRRTKTAAQRQELRDDIAAMMMAISPLLPRDWTLAQLTSWLNMREKSLELSVAMTTAASDEKAADEDGDALKNKLMDVANTVGLHVAEDAQVEDLVLILQSAIEHRSHIDASQAAVGERSDDVESRKAALDKAKDRQQVWRKRWADTLAKSWLSDDKSVPSVSGVREVLRELDELAPLVDKRASLEENIHMMEHDHTRFVTQTHLLANSLAMDLTPAPMVLAGQIIKMLEEAKTLKIERDAAGVRLAEIDARAKTLEAERDIHATKIAQMMDRFQLSSLDEVGEALHQLEIRIDLHDQASQAEKEMLIALGEDRLDLAEQILDKIDRGSVETQIAELDLRIENLLSRAEQLYSEKTTASDRIEAVGGDDKAATIEAQRRTIMLEIEDGARHYLRMRLGVSAAERALRLYRDQHRSAMMACASDAFRLISRGKYKGLATQPDKSGEVLVAVSDHDASKIASDLSKGTRFQLYLALRVAGYREFVLSRSAIPFIADDIMETFDDFRAEEAFKLFADMATTGQVIYLTHHRHLCDIAERVCPGVKIHRLGG